MIGRGALSIVALIFACAPDLERRETGNSANANNALSAVVATYRVPTATLERSKGAIEFAVQALVIATAISNSTSVRAYGKLTEATDGRLSYEAQPTDRLVIDRPRVHIELALVEIEGSGSDAGSLLAGNHRIRVRVLASDELTGEVWSARTGASREIGFQGRSFVDALWWAADLRRSGIERFDVDQTGSQLFDDHGVTGTLESETGRIDVRERWTFDLVSAGRDSANSAVRLIDSVLNGGGSRVEWSGVRTKKAFRNGKPTELDTFWEGSGSVTVNAKVVGTVEKFASVIDRSSGGFVGFQLVTSDGAVELERFQAY